MITAVLKIRTKNLFRNLFTGYGIEPHVNKPHINGHEKQYFQLRILI